LSGVKAGFTSFVKTLNINKDKGNMPRIAGVNIPENKQILIALTYIYGIGLALARKILIQARIDFQKKAKDLTPEEINRLKEIIEKNYKIEGELRREVMMNIKRLKDIGAWRGIRHLKGLPVRGQRTRTNTRTVRGNVRKTVGSGRKPPPAPT
jgi:small subunit ribosomal protein S13